MADVERDLDMAKKIAELVDKAGGRTFFVGGYVRDKILGIKNKDIDIEIHGIQFSELRSILNELGEPDERKVGDSFGILALRSYDLDIAMPRAERASGGGGHKDFIIEVDPFIGTEKAARRRDFTINALMEDVLTGEVLDFFGGIGDLKEKKIRHVDPATFIEDPLRVFRAAQFAARFGFGISEDTVELARGMDVTGLSRERVAAELDKALIKADEPSVFFDSLRKMGHLKEWFPEVESLIGVQQRPDYHPEGDVYTHTMMVLDKAAKCRSKAGHPKYFMVAALCHDEKAGVEPAKRFVNRIYNENYMRHYVANMTLLHGKTHTLINNGAKTRAFMTLFDTSCHPEDLILIARCDNNGKALDVNYEADEQKLREELGKYDNLMAQPSVTGNDLVALGYKPGKEFKEILDSAHKMHLSGVPKDIALRQIMGTYRLPKADIAEETAEVGDDDIGIG